MMRTALVACAIGVLALAACHKAEHDQAVTPPAGTVVTAKVGSDGVRRIPIAVNTDGYTPVRIPGKPGEKLVLVFTRTVDASCIAQLKTPDGKLIDLPMNQPTEVAVTVPQAGEVGFACGMDMFHGVVVAQPAT